VTRRFSRAACGMLPPSHEPRGRLPVMVISAWFRPANFGLTERCDQPSRICLAQEQSSITCSPEAQVARDAYRAAGSEIASLIRSSVSGRELVSGGFPQDVEIAVADNVSSIAPMLTDGAYRNTNRVS
jgi:hypothetical protein